MFYIYNIEKFSKISKLLENFFKISDYLGEFENAPSICESNLI